jgi:hypothetical protein
MMGKFTDVFLLCIIRFLFSNFTSSTLDNLIEKLDRSITNAIQLHHGFSNSQPPPAAPQVEDSGLQIRSGTGWKPCTFRSNPAVSIRENDRSPPEKTRIREAVLRSGSHRTGNGVFQTFPSTGKQSDRQRILPEKIRNPQELSIK